MTQKPGILLLFIFLCLHVNTVLGQACSTLGQTPATAFPVCGTTKFEQDNVPLCSTNSLFVPGCSGNGNANYENRNPFWYKFTCYIPGSLGFVITPKDLTDDYDWQLYDVTGLDPQEVFTNRDIIVSGNWAGNPGPTGTSINGANFIQCASAYNGTEPRFAKMPELILGHEYILLVSHFTNSQSGYSLSFAGGTAVITDPAEPHLQKATPSCDGSKITLKLNKKIRCGSLTASGSEFSLSPALTSIVSAVAANCSSSFDFDELTLTLASPLPSNNYQLIINKGSDNNSLLDNCDRAIPDAEQTAFAYIIPQPIPIDSVGRSGCAPNTIKLYFSKKIDCSSIATNGSNFLISGPTPVNVISAVGDCTSGLSDIITVKFQSPVYTKGLYTVTPKLSVNGGAVVDECGKIIQPLPVSFTTSDTVSARFNYNNALGCRFDTLAFSHNGAHDVNKWEWIFNNSLTYSTSSHSIIFPASSTNTVNLKVTNGVCTDSVASSIVLDNEVKVDFKMPDFICPEDPFITENT
ncbi:MAG: gliding motility-associated C-terminal domain-containing protein, partial [Chitinophagaceae bacterium]